MTKADIEFYESTLVLAAARALLPAGKSWDCLSYRSRQVHLDRAVAMLDALINDRKCRDRLVRLGSSQGV